MRSNVTLILRRLSLKKLFSIVLILTASAALAQTKNPVSTVLRDMLPRQQKKLTAAVDAMPAAKFAYKPTPEQMTFAHLVMHITESNNHLCSLLGDGLASKASELKETDTKEKLAAELQASFDYCAQAVEKMDDSKLGDTVKGHGGDPAPRAWAAIALTNDWADHYAAAAMYLRLNGILPPTAKK